MLTQLPSAVLIDNDGTVRRSATDVVRVELSPKCMGVLVAGPGVDRTLAGDTAGLGE
ncbi:hypothetical protein IWW36_006273, partial [Coemansia brasiliensis]